MPLDDADKKTIQEMIGEALKGDELTKAIGEAASTAAAKAAKAAADAAKADLVKKIEGIESQIPKPEGGDKGGDKGDDKVTKRLEALQLQLEAEKKAREEAEQRRATEALHGAAREALQAAGVPGDRIRAALALLKDEGRIKLDDDGNPVMQGKDQYGIEALVPIADGVQAWLKSDDGKVFVPPVGVAGTGEGPSQAPTFVSKDGKLDVDAIGRTLFRHIGAHGVDGEVGTDDAQRLING